MNPSEPDYARVEQATRYLIPCHRALRQTGSFDAYRRGRTRKRAILGWESARHPIAENGAPLGNSLADGLRARMATRGPVR